MKKTIIKSAVFILVFLISMIVISKIMNHGNMDLTQDVVPATYPVAYMMIDGQRCNAMLGYAETIQPQLVRENISLIGEDRNVSMEVDTFGNHISKVFYEVRSVDGSRLVENTQVYNYTLIDDRMKIQFSVKDLITADKQYTLVLLLEKEDGEVIRYYTRMMQTTKYHLTDYLEFVKEFHESTFQKETAPIITDHIESNSQGDNTTFAKVNIHSKADQITWGSLNIVGETSPVIQIVEIGSEQASFVVQFMVFVEQDDERYQYRVEEYFRCRYTSDRMYLLNYEREMNQLLQTSNTMVMNDKIMMGISTGDIELVENESGTNLAFGTNGILYAFQIADNKLSVLYNPYETGSPDYRTVFARQKCQVLSVSESGDVIYMVYGHLSQGSREGRVGIQVFRYSASTNSIEEKAFIPCQQSENALMAEIDRLSYVNMNNILFFVLGENLYRIDLNEAGYRIVAENLRNGTYQYSEDYSMIVWQDIREEEGQDQNSCEKMVLFNLNTELQTEILADSRSFVKPLGFMENDLIYGAAYRADITTDHTGKVVFPMYQLQIQDADGNILMKYQHAGIYVVGLSMEENLIALQRVQKQEESLQYLAASDDQILCNESEQTQKNQIITVATANMEKITEISLTKAVSKASTQKLTPKEVIVEENRSIDLEKTYDLSKQYYVFNRNGVTAVCTEVSDAIREADATQGFVLNDVGEYVWRTGNRLLSNQIMAIEAGQVSEEKGALAICLEAMLTFEGVSRNVEAMLRDGQTPVSILQNNLRSSDVFYLTGCSLSSALYFVNAEYPVLAILKDGSAVLIVGYNQQNTVLMNPLTGTISKKGIKDSTEFFNENGNVFITYMHKSDIKSE